MARLKKRKPARDAKERRARRGEFIESLRDESDRGLVLISAAYICEKLKEVLQAKIQQNPEVPEKLIASLFNAHAPLESFAARIKFAFLLSLVDNYTFHDLETVREIRNHFAHDYARAAFGDENVSCLACKLKTANRAFERFGAPPDFDTACADDINNQSKKERARFTLAVSEIANQLEERLRGFAASPS